MNRTPNHTGARPAKPGSFTRLAARAVVRFGLFRSVTLPLFGLTAMFAVTACERTTAPTAGPTHTVRGRVMKLPVAGDPASSFSVFHEEIKDWLRPDGSKGMGAMVMPFPLASGVAVDTIQVGDIVELSVRQYTTGPLPYEATAIRKLAADTPLTLPERGN